jgi:hypothetical protein
MRSLDFKERPYSLLSASERSSTTKVGDLRRGHYIAKAEGASRMYREVILKIKRCIQSYFFFSLFNTCGPIPSAEWMDEVPEVYPDATPDAHTARTVQLISTEQSPECVYPRKDDRRNPKPHEKEAGVEDGSTEG